MTVLGIDSPCQLYTGYINRRGYGMIKHTKRGPSISAHREAWEKVHGPIPPGMVVMHLCDVPSCINVDHLRLGTQAENLADMRAKGRDSPPPRMPGEHNHQAKLTEAQVREILTSSDTGVALAARFGVSPSTISLIRRGKKWRHLSLSLV